jgi:hypothetical protein
MAESPIGWRLLRHFIEDALLRQSDRRTALA